MGTCSGGGGGRGCMEGPLGAAPMSLGLPLVGRRGTDSSENNTSVHRPIGEEIHDCSKEVDTIIETVYYDSRAPQTSSCTTIINPYFLSMNILSCRYILDCKRLFYTTRGVAPWWSGEGMQLQHMKHRPLYKQRSHPLVVRRENAASTHEA